MRDNKSSEISIQCLHRSDLVSSQVLENPNVKRSNLSCEIHPIFHHKHWTHTTPKLYEILQPALRLASYFLTHQSCLEYWCTVLLGKVEFRADVNWNVIIPPPLDKSDFDTTIELLTGAAGKIRLGWYRHDDIDAFATAVPDTQLSPPGQEILLDKNFQKFAEKEYKTCSLCHQLRFQFFIALNLAHETVHAVRQLIYPGIEPYFRVYEPEPELGSSWERFTFGNKIQPINLSFDCADGLMTGRIEYLQELKQTFVVYSPIPMDFIASFFQEETWSAANAYGRSLFQAPLTPHCSVTPHTFDWKGRRL
ncbi:hypothetical protein L228DRAFT_281249 [Xylona heveae TC161]|uniref:Uncharacterized protein n=1 Tax=Xylona heveae (strain CBS 132557 / TC161) TaxID=1328760 RepID=A0A165HZL8_XYLHT|nr:hypothetical protein L228DRAFT_281249 [Xylona heveae TC161]KZF24143.1 hypothetical protein L228DRAFT_281249 [Xylona heveae TC161]